MEAGETMVETIRSNLAPTTPASTVTTAAGETHEGIKQYYIQKIEELQVENEKERVEERISIGF